MDKIILIGAVINIDCNKSPTVFLKILNLWFLGRKSTADCDSFKQFLTIIILHKLLVWQTIQHFIFCITKYFLGYLLDRNSLAQRPNLKLFFKVTDPYNTIKSFSRKFPEISYMRISILHRQNRLFKNSFLVKVCCLHFWRLSLLYVFKSHVLEHIKCSINIFFLFHFHYSDVLKECALSQTILFLILALPLLAVVTLLLPLLLCSLVSS